MKNTPVAMKCVAVVCIVIVAMLAVGGCGRAAAPKAVVASRETQATTTTATKSAATTTTTVKKSAATTTTTPEEGYFLNRPVHTYRDPKSGIEMTIRCQEITRVYEPSTIPPSTYQLEFDVRTGDVGFHLQVLVDGTDVELILNPVEPEWGRHFSSDQMARDVDKAIREKAIAVRLP